MNRRRSYGETLTRLNVNSHREGEKNSPFKCVREINSWIITVCNDITVVSEMSRCIAVADRYNASFASPTNQIVLSDHKVSIHGKLGNKQRNQNRNQLNQ